jgi:hypothetical protein
MIATRWRRASWRNGIQTTLNGRLTVKARLESISARTRIDDLGQARSRTGVGSPGLLGDAGTRRAKLDPKNAGMIRTWSGHRYTRNPLMIWIVVV